MSFLIDLVIFQLCPEIPTNKTLSNATHEIIESCEEKTDHSIMGDVIIIAAQVKIFAFLKHL